MGGPRTFEPSCSIEGWERGIMSFWQVVLIILAHDALLIAIFLGWGLYRSMTWPYSCSLP